MYGNPNGVKFKRKLTAINFSLGDNLITSHQVDCMSSAQIPAEAVEKGQEHITSCRNKVGT